MEWEGRTHSAHPQSLRPARPPSAAWGVGGRPLRTGSGYPNTVMLPRACRELQEAGVSVCSSGRRVLSPGRFLRQNVMWRSVNQPPEGKGPPWPLQGELRLTSWHKKMASLSTLHSAERTAGLGPTIPSLWPSTLPWAPATPLPARATLQPSPRSRGPACFRHNTCLQRAHIPAPACDSY